MHRAFLCHQALRFIIVVVVLRQLWEGVIYLFKYSVYIARLHYAMYNIYILINDCILGMSLRYCLFILFSTPHLYIHFLSN